MIAVNTETIPGMRIAAMKGIVQGNTVRAKHFGRDLAAGLKNLVGGELTGYTELLTEARREELWRSAAMARAFGVEIEEISREVGGVPVVERGGGFEQDGDRGRALRDDLDKEDTSADKIKSGIQNVTEAAMKLGEAIYKSAQEEGEYEPTAADEAHAGDEDIVDADFEDLDEDKRS